MHSLWVATDQESVELKDTLKTGAPPSRNIGVKVCSILAAFRAFDMAVQLSGTRTKGKVAIYSKKAMKVGIDVGISMSTPAIRLLTALETTIVMGQNV